MAWIGTAVVGSAVIGGLASAYSANKAAATQTAAADKAIALQQGQSQQTRSDLSPYRAIGSTAADDLTTRLPALTAPINMDQATLEQTPGYQFNRTQGLKAVQNSAAARGLGVSVAALKGAATFATGLADSTYQNQFNNAQTNQKNAFDRLSALVNTGENAGAQTGALGEKAAYNSGTATVGAGNAVAAADNKIGSSIANTANGIGSYAAYKGLYGGGGSGGNGAGDGSWYGTSSVGGAQLA